MADKLGIDAAIAIELLFEGENHECLIDVLAKQSHPTLSPGPELRADVIDDGNSTLFHLPRHAPVECGRVDDDGQVGLAAVRLFYQTVKQPPDFGKVPEDFSDADDGKVFRVNYGVAAGGTHFVAAHTEEVDRRGEFAAQGLDQLRPVHFAGSLACRDQNSHTAL